MLTEEQQLRSDAHAARNATEMIAVAYRELLQQQQEAAAAARVKQKRDHRFVIIGVLVICSLLVLLWR